MHFPVPHFRSPPVPEPPAQITLVTPSDVQWSRPIFKAPPITLNPKAIDAALLAADLRRIGLVTR